MIFFCLPSTVVGCKLTEQVNQEAQCHFCWSLDRSRIAAQAFVESGFDVEQVSWAGARGLMQLMPGTAKAFGCPTERIRDPELNVKAAVRCLRELDSSLARKVPQRTERLKFVLAAYNSGIAHILDAMALAGKYGMDPTRWDGNVRRALMLKSQP